MLVTYCSSCGKPNYYIKEQPVKCRGCNKTLLAAFAPKANEGNQNSYKFFVPHVEEEIPDIDALEFEPMEKPVFGVKFGEVMQQKGVNYKRTDNPQPVDPEQFKKQWKEEAGNVKRSIEIEDE